VYFEGSFHPICLAEDDDDIAAAVCLAAGFPDGGYFVKNADAVREKNALPVYHHYHFTRSIATVEASRHHPVLDLD
jgi:hypothetical protein